MPTKSKTGGWTKDIFERDGLYFANLYAPEDSGFEDQSLGTFSTQVQAERAAEDALVSHMYHAERAEEDDKLRREQWEAEQARLKAHNDRHLAARDVPDHKESRATKAAAEQQHGTHEPA